VSARSPQGSPMASPMSGADRLALGLKLIVDGTEVKLFGAQVKHLHLVLTTYGFEGELELLQAEDKAKGGAFKDPLLAHITSQKLINIELTVSAIRPDLTTEQGRAPLKVAGLVCERGYSETPYREMQGNTVLARRYRLRFVDPARHLWQQHFPCALFTEKTLKDVVDTYKGDKIKIEYDAPPFDATRPLIFLGCQPGPGAASFYDWLLWLVDAQGLVFFYDYAEQKYKITAQKDASGAPAKLHPEDLGALWVDVPEAPRHKAYVLNAYSEDAQVKTIDNSHSAAEIRQDHLIRTSVAAQVDERESLERTRLRLRKPELRVDMRRFPSDALVPGQLVKLEDPQSRYGGFGLAIPALLKDKNLRLTRLELVADSTAPGVDDEQQQQQSGFQVEATLRFEQKEEEYVRLPLFRAPTYPRYVEGKIVSEVGADDEETYQIYTDSNTSIDQYQVTVPLFADQKIKVPFNPNLFSGHYYFPAYKGERVLLAMDLFRAWLKRFLDWRPDARLPADTQGNHLLLGKKPTSSTSLRHVYEDSKPVFKIKRTNEKDTSVIEIKEGTLTIEVKEEQ
jgi:hypothetical protein